MRQRTRFPRQLARAAREPLGLSFTASTGIQALNVVTGVLLARTLGPHGRGELAATLLLPTLLAAFGGLGISEAATFHMASATTTPAVIAGVVLVTTAAQSVVLAGVGAALVPLTLHRYDAEVVRDSYLFLLYIPLYLAGFNFTGVLNGMHRFLRSNTLRISLVALTALGLVALWRADALSLTNAVLVYLAANLLYALIAVFLVFDVIRGRPRFSKSAARDLLVYGLKSHTSAVSSLVNERIDQLAISVFLGPAKLGLYVIAVTLTSVTTLIGSSVAMVALPVVARLRTVAERARAASRFVAPTLLLGAAFTIALVLFTGPLIRLFFGGAFDAATPPARVLLVAAIFFGLNRVLGNILKAVNRPLAAGVAELLAVGATIAGLAVFLPSLGILGAAVASLIAYVVSSVWLTRQASRALGTSAWRLFILDRTHVVHES